MSVFGDAEHLVLLDPFHLFLQLLDSFVHRKLTLNVNGVQFNNLLNHNGNKLLQRQRDVIPASFFKVFSQWVLLRVMI